MTKEYAVILANAGIQLLYRHPRERGDPAFSFKSLRFKLPKDVSMDSRVRGNDESLRFRLSRTGMTKNREKCPRPRW